MQQQSTRYLTWWKIPLPFRWHVLFSIAQDTPWTEATAPEFLDTARACIVRARVVLGDEHPMHYTLEKLERDLYRAASLENAATEWMKRRAPTS